jgi:hypothetical protein
MLGYVGGITELFHPETNIRYGVMYLARAWKLAGGDLCRALMKYRAGWGEERITPLSAAYCRRARQHLATIGSPLAAGMPVPVTFQERLSASASVSFLPVAPIGPPRPVVANTNQVLPPARPNGPPVAKANIKVASAAPFKPLSPIPPVDMRRLNAKRAMWAAHDVRMRAITARVSDTQLRISGGI